MHADPDSIDAILELAGANEDPRNEQAPVSNPAPAGSLVGLLGGGVVLTLVGLFASSAVAGALGLAALFLFCVLTYRYVGELVEMAH